MPELCHHVIRRIAAAPVVEPLYDCFQPFHVRTQLLGYPVDNIRSAAIGNKHRFGTLFIPFAREHFVTGGYLSGDTAVSYQIDDSARTVFDCRGAEFYFYCSHTYIV